MSFKNNRDHNNPMWKGDAVGYNALHTWVKLRLGSPEECENCGDQEAPMYDWANISGGYKRDLSDWARLCRRCHQLIENRNKISANKRPLNYARHNHLRKDSKTRHPGVNWHKASGKWSVRIGIGNGYRINIGVYDSLEEAISIRQVAERNYSYGEAVLTGLEVF